MLVGPTATRTSASATGGASSTPRALHRAADAALSCVPDLLRRTPLRPARGPCAPTCSPAAMSTSALAGSRASRCARARWCELLAGRWRQGHLGGRLNRNPCFPNNPCFPRRLQPLLDEPLRRAGGEHRARARRHPGACALLTRRASSDQEWFAPLNITGTLFPFSGRHSEVCAREVLHFMGSTREPSSIYACARQARENAPRGARRDHLRDVGGAERHLARDAADGRGEDAHARHLQLLRRGEGAEPPLPRVTFGTMHRDDAYEFARLGTHMERAIPPRASST
jgi:hypothetical protein